MMYTRRQTSIYSTTGVFFTYGSGMNFQNKTFSTEMHFYETFPSFVLLITTPSVIDKSKQERYTQPICKVSCAKWMVNANAMQFSSMRQNILVVLYLSNLIIKIFLIYNYSLFGTKLFLASKLFDMLRHSIEDLLHYYYQNIASFCKTSLNN